MASLCSGVGAFVVLFFKQKTAYEMRISDWSSDVCSSDLHRIRDVGDLGSYVPNVVLAEGTGLGSAVVIRGVGASSRNIGFDSRVGVYLDGVYLRQSPAINQPLVALERAEGLPGPQGALFGKNKNGRAPDRERGGE